MEVEMSVEIGGGSICVGNVVGTITLHPASTNAKTRDIHVRDIHFIVALFLIVAMTTEYR
ncbi:MAG TPA: hypothetical protein DCZ08_10330 [Anaerolineaceae bacterium]|nr:hypothetical protein [Anaerolineaceae bacterium]